MAEGKNCYKYFKRNWSSKMLTFPKIRQEAGTVNQGMALKGKMFLLDLFP